MRLKVGLVTGVALVFGLVGVFATQSEASTPEKVLAKVRDAASKTQVKPKESTWRVITDSPTNGKETWRVVTDGKLVKKTAKSGKLVLDGKPFEKVKFGTEPFTLILEEKGTKQRFTILKYDSKSYAPKEWIWVEKKGEKWTVKPDRRGGKKK